MPDTKQKSFAESLLKKTARGTPDDDPEKTFTSERQHTAQAFNLHVERRDGRRSEGFAWSHYAGYQWTDEGEHERLIVVFGMRAVEIEGHNLGVLVAEIREGQLNSIRELASGQAQLLQQGNPDNQPIIASVRSYPDFADILKEIKGEDEREHGFARKVSR
jgi:hypothetical protein